MCGCVLAYFCITSCRTCVESTVPAKYVKVISQILTFQVSVCSFLFSFFFLSQSERWRLRNFSRRILWFLRARSELELRGKEEKNNSNCTNRSKRFLGTEESFKENSSGVPGEREGEGEEGNESWNPWRSYVHWLQARLSIMHVCMYPERRGTDHISNACTAWQHSIACHNRAARYACVIHAFYRKHKGGYPVLFIARQLYFRKHLTCRRGPRLSSHSLSLSLPLFPRRK